MLLEKNGFMMDEHNRMYHIQCKPGDIGRYVLLPGDPFRTDKIARYLNNARLVAHNREHKTWTGYLEGEKVSVVSTGMGCPSTAIALEELVHLGADTFIRVGTAGCINEELRKPDTLGGIITGAVRGDGTTDMYVPKSYPAISDRHIVDALSVAAEKLGYHFDEGISYTKDSFYSYCLPATVPMGEQIKAEYAMWKKANVLLTEMEAAAVLVISSIRGCRAAGIMAYSDAVNVSENVDKEIQTACEAIRILIQKDKAN